MSSRISAAVKPYLLPEADRHVASRFAYGVDDVLVREVRAAGSGLRWFERQLNYTAINDSAADAAKAWYPLLKHDAVTKYKNSRAGGPGSYEYGQAFVNYWVAHAMLTKRHVHEQMVSFWGNLLYIAGHEDRTFPFRFDFDQVIRRHALTSYRELLRAAITHPAMSAWLNNNQNVAKGINENLGRELLELYTLGRESGYTEQDVQDCARLLTGFRTKEGDTIQVWYDTSKHWTGPVSIFGFHHANADRDGRAAVNALIDHLALQPATAQHVARRLCQRFVSDTPPAAIVSAVASAYLASGSDIRSTLRALVNHPQFAATRRQRVRNPIDDVISTARVVGSRPVRPAKQAGSMVQHAIYMATDAGFAPFRWPRPDGFPEVSTAYVSSARMIRTWNYHVALASNRWKSTAVSRATPASVLPTRFPRRLDEIVEHQSRLLLGRPADSTALSTICTLLGVSRAHRYRRVSDVPVKHLDVIRGMILNLPDGMKR